MGTRWGGWPSRCRWACRHCPVWQKATHTGRKSGHPPSLVKALVTRVITSSQRKRARRPLEHALAASSRPPCCATRVFVTRSPLAGVHAVVPADSRGVPRGPLCIPCVPGTMLGTRPCRTDTVPADMSWVLPLPGPRFFPWNTPGRWAARPSCVPPDMSPCHPVAQPLVSDGTIGLSAFDVASGLALCSPWPSLPFPATSTGTSTGTFTASFIAVGTWR